ncbi:hypothetical protein SB781_35285, partial [Paraburkholderia sp. SIMBA_061]
AIPLKTINRIMLTTMEKAVMRKRFLFRLMFRLANCPSIPNSFPSSFDFRTEVTFSTFVPPEL